MDLHGTQMDLMVPEGSSSPGVLRLMRIFGILLPLWSGFHVPRAPRFGYFGVLISLDVEVDPIPGSGGVNGNSNPREKGIPPNLPLTEWK